jgi:transcriptional regulator NrdR family protein
VADSKSGIRCPKCGSVETRVTRTTSGANTKQRERRCKGCGVLFVTLEAWSCFLSREHAAKA